MDEGELYIFEAENSVVMMWNLNALMVRYFVVYRVGVFRFC